MCTQAYLGNLLHGLLVNLDGCHGLLHVAKHHVQMLVVRLQTHAPNQASKHSRGFQQPRTCSFPCSSRSPRSLTRMRSSRLRRSRPRGSFTAALSITLSTKARHCAHCARIHAVRHRPRHRQPLHVLSPPESDPASSCFRDGDRAYAVFRAIESNLIF
jgi:hypothetical protein